MIVIYAEKADVGNKIAAALGGFRLPDGTLITFKNRAAREEDIKKFQRQQGYLDITFKGEPCRVTWGYGHLYGLCDVPEYEPSYKAWKARPTCFIPEQFKLHPTSGGSSGFQKVLDKQRAVIRDLFKKASYVINATDYDREGELIFAYVCEAIGYRKPFFRVLFTSQTEEGIQKAFKDLIPSAKVKGIEEAGRARGIYDWLIGTNLSTRMTLAFPGNGVLSIGRVQTPVLKMVVDREEAINGFVPKVSWNIKGVFQVGKESYSGIHKGSGDLTKADADSIVRSISGKPGVVTKLETKRTKREAPLLYSQTSLQIDANKYFGYTAKQTMETAQFLYEHGYASYPRTKSQYLTDDMEPDVVTTLRALSGHPDYEKFLSGIALKPAKRYFDSSKVISHYAIIPTKEIPKTLSGANKNIYDLLAWSLIRTIYSDAIIEKTSVVTTVDSKYDFASSGSVIIDAGWMAVQAMSKETVLPVLTRGASYPGSYEGKETKTEPPKRYDDGSLVKAMKTAGKDLDDAAFRAILADPNVEGIGTDATRAEIIETLLRREYMVRKGKVFYATQKGIDLIHRIPVPDMMSAEFTARMEQSLAQIEKGELSYSVFLGQVNRQVRDWCDKVAVCSKTASAAKPAVTTFTAAPFEEEEYDEPTTSGGKASAARKGIRKSPGGKSGKSSALKCPICGAELQKRSKVWACSDESCGFVVFGEILSHKMTDKEVNALVKKGTTDVISDFISKKTGKPFSAKLTVDTANHRVVFKF